MECMRQQQLKTEVHQFRAILQGKAGPNGWKNPESQT